MRVTLVQTYRALVNEYVVYDITDPDEIKAFLELDEWDKEETLWQYTQIDSDIEIVEVYETTDVEILTDRLDSERRG